MNSDAEEVVNRHEGNQHVNGRRGDDAEPSCTYCGRDLHDLAQESEAATATYGYSSRVATEDLCTHTACRTRWITSREDIPIRRPAYRANRRGRREADLSTRRNFSEGYP